MYYVYFGQFHVNKKETKKEAEDLAKQMKLIYGDFVEIKVVELNDPRVIN